MSKLDQYQTFITIVEQGSITKAAALLNLSVPALSKQLVQLEESLQVQLFHRSHKRLDITESGKQFYPKCKEILSSIDHAEEALLSEQESISGTIAITLSKALCRSKIIDILSSFTSIHPRIKFDIQFSDELEDLYDKDIDFAFRLGRLNDSSTMVAMPLIETQLVACATPAYIESVGMPESLASPGNAKFILMSSLNPAGELKAFLNKEKFDFDQSVSHTTNDVEGVYQLINGNMGIGMMLNISIQKELDEGRFVSVLSKRNLPRKRLYLLSKKTQWQTKKLKAFKEHINLMLSEPNM
ncbi:LysR family transcriptional regulator [Litoribrevibacter euphylliae]|uniref:LysR family transcriptional regulator n=1 Tax=Litoribrevibacter euphylliae TaxID=1834034 RepID=A0ABV7HHC4_9GAMM